ncbi:MAG: ComEC/Rec2 family competence protein [Patescibacteria group bacterium]
MIKLSRKYVKYYAVILGAAMFLWQFAFNGNGSGFLEADFFDVGQGDAIFFEGPDGFQVLVDGGPDSTVLEKLGKEMGYFDRYIDIVVATHPDKDHVGGLMDVLKYYNVGEVWIGALENYNFSQSEFLRVLEEKKILVKYVEVGDNFNLGGLKISVFNPSLKEKLKDNESSVVLKILYGGVSFLLTADITASVEKKLIESEGNALYSDILKAAHHGSKTSTSDDFLKTVSPEIAIIQVGQDNSYGHPHQSVLERFEKFGIPFFRTDKNGDIEIISDGKNYTVNFEN